MEFLNSIDGIIWLAIAGTLLMLIAAALLIAIIPPRQDPKFKGSNHPFFVASDQEIN